MPHATDDQAMLPLEGMPQPPPPEPSAGDLVAAWCAGFTETRGSQPDPSVVRRVAGVCRALAKDRTDMDSWRDAWRGCRAAGLRGRWDIVSELAAPVTSPGRGNHFLQIVGGSQQTAVTSAPMLGGLG